MDQTKESIKIVESALVQALGCGLFKRFEDVNMLQSAWARVKEDVEYIGRRKQDEASKQPSDIVTHDGAGNTDI